MDKETLSNSDETEEECRTGRSSILKPQKPRTPFQEVTFRSVTEEFDLTNRRKRVSFANVNIVKEFCSKSESQHIGSIQPYEETFSHSSDSSHNSNSLLSRNSTGQFIISPGKQESPNSSVYNEESMELTSNSICEPNIFGQNPKEVKSETKYSFPSMENTCADKECTEANMSMTNVLNFHYQIPDQGNLFKRNYLEMSDMEFTEALPMKVTNRTLNFPKDLESSVMEFTEVLPGRLVISSPTSEDQDLSIEDKSKRKPRKTLTCDEVEEKSSKEILENQNVSVDMSLVTTGFTGLNRWSFKPNQNNPVFNTVDESLDMSLVTTSSIALHKVKPLQPVNDNLENPEKTNSVKSTKNDDFVNIAPGRKSIKPSFCFKDDDMSLVSSNSAVLNRSVKPQEILSKNDDLSNIPPERKSIKPSFSLKDDDMSLVSSTPAVLNRLSVKPQEILSKNDDLSNIPPVRIRVKPSNMSLVSESALNSVKCTNDESLDMSLLISNSKLSIKPDAAVNLLTNPATRLSVNPFKEDSIEEQDSIDLVYSETLPLNGRKSIKPVYVVDDPENIQNISEEGIPDQAPRLSVYPVEKDDSTNNQDEFAQILPHLRKSIKPVYADDPDNIQNISAEGLHDQAPRLSVYPVEKDDSANNQDEFGQILPNLRKSIKPVYVDDPENIQNIFAEGIHDQAPRLSVYPVEKDTQILPTLRKSIKPSYNDPENKVSSDMNLADGYDLNIERSTARLSIYPLEKDDSTVDNQEDAQILPTLRKSIKTSYNNPENDVSADINIEGRNNDKPDRQTRLSFYPTDIVDDESSDLVLPASKKSMKPDISTDENFITGSSAGLRVKPSKLSIVSCQKDESIPNIQDVSLPTEPTFSTINENLCLSAKPSKLSIVSCQKDESIPNIQDVSLPTEPTFSTINENLCLSAKPSKLSIVSCQKDESIPNIQDVSLPTEPTFSTINKKSHLNTEYRKDNNILENSLMSGVAPLSPEPNESFMLEEEIDNKLISKASFKYDDLEPVSFVQKSIIPMELNDSSVMDDDYDYPQKPTAEKSQDLEMCISPYGKEIKNKTLTETASKTPKSKISPELEMCITPGKESNITNKTPKSTVSKTLKNTNSEMDPFKLYNLETKSINFMNKLGFKWMSFLKWKIVIFDDFYLVVELSQTEQINDATRINKMYFRRGPYVQEEDIVDFIENNFRTNFPNFECSIIGNIKIIVNQINSFWKEQEPIINSMMKLRLRYPFDIEDQKMTFNIYNVEKLISFDVTINLTEWRTGITNEHISVDQHFGETVSEHLVKYLWKPEVDFVNYVIDLKKYVFLSP